MEELSQTRPREFEPLFLSILISDGNQRHGLIAADKKENMEQRFSRRGSSIIIGARERSHIRMHGDEQPKPCPSSYSLLFS